MGLRILWTVAALVFPGCHCDTHAFSAHPDSAAGEGGTAEGVEVGAEAAATPDGALSDVAAWDAPTILEAGTVDAQGNGTDAGGGIDACVPTACLLASGYSYCGRIGDGCGGALACECPTLPNTLGAMICEANLCRPVTGCRSPGLALCDLVSGTRYCGVVGDGCQSGNVDCGGCSRSGWECVDGICVGAASVCTRRQTCDVGNGDTYCGTLGDGCGGNLSCGTHCPLAGWLCQNNLCSAPASVCTKATCRPATGGQYCGDLSDGCGGTLRCGDCDGGAACGTILRGVCGDGLPEPHQAPTPAPLPVGASPAPLPPPPPLPPSNL